MEARTDKRDRWRERPGERARGRRRCPCRAKEEGHEKWQHVVELPRETGDLGGQRGTWGLTPKKTIQPIPSNHSLPRWGGKLSDLQMGIDLQLNLPFFYKPVGGALTECHWTGVAKIPTFKKKDVGCTTSISLESGYITGGERHQQPPVKLEDSSGLRRTFDTPFWRVNHWFSHEVFPGMVSTTHQWWRGTRIFRLETWCANLSDVAVMGLFCLSSLKFFLWHKTAKKRKSSELSNMTSIE